jgi:ERCC4-related helicase
MTKRKPSESQDHLRLIVEWMDETFNKNDDSSLIFFENFRANNESFNKFFNKKYNAYLVKEGKRPPAKIYQFKKK